MKYAIKEGRVINRVTEGATYGGCSIIEADVELSSLFDSYGIPKYKYDGEIKPLTQEERIPFLEARIDKLREQKYWNEANKFFMDAAYLRLCGKEDEAVAQEAKFKTICDEIKQALPKTGV